MHPTSTVMALCSCVLWLGACDKTPPMPPAPVVSTPAPTESGVTTGSAGNTSVPAAEAVLLPANAAQTASAAGRSNSGLTNAQESTAMPMPGQVNDHSAPVVPGKGASAP